MFGVTTIFTTVFLNLLSNKSKQWNKQFSDKRFALSLDRSSLITMEPADNFAISSKYPPAEEKNPTANCFGEPIKFLSFKKILF